MVENLQRDLHSTSRDMQRDLYVAIYNIWREETGNDDSKTWAEFDEFYEKVLGNLTILLNNL